MFCNPPEFGYVLPVIEFEILKIGVICNDHCFVCGTTAGHNINNIEHTESPHGCFDTEVTYTAIGQKIEEGMRVGRFKQLAKAIKKQGGFSIELFTDACNNGDQEALELMEETVMNICSALSWIYYMIDPAVIMVSSKLDKYVDFYKLISSTLYKRYENNFTYGKFKIEPAPFGEYLGAVGAAAYVYEKNLANAA